MLKWDQKLDAPAQYFPLEKGTYEIAPLLRPFGFDFGNGALDRKIFQFDSLFEVFRKNKTDARKENLAKYYLEHEFKPDVKTAIARLIAARLIEESPDFFSFETINNGESSLSCALTREKLFFDPEFRLMRVETHENSVEPAYVSAIDALCSQVQEDVFTLSLDPKTQKNWLSLAHAAATSNWAPSEKIGKDWIGIHLPVPQASAMLSARAAAGIVNAMVYKGPYVRFVWGLTPHNRPNHHPEPPPGVSLEEWRGGTKPRFVWVERQVIWPCPEAHASLFTIRASFIPLEEVLADPGRRTLFKSSLLSTSVQVREYKGFDTNWDMLSTLLNF